LPTLRVLLDECLDRGLRKEFSGHIIKTVPEMGWAGMKNGVLLGRAEQVFDVFVTVDRNLTFQQQTSRFKIAIVVLHASSNRAEDLRHLVPRALKMMTSLRPGRVVHIS
jgi:hypothetical protein